MLHLSFEFEFKILNPNIELIFFYFTCTVWAQSCQRPLKFFLTKMNCERLGGEAEVWKFG